MTFWAQWQVGTEPTLHRSEHLTEADAITYATTLNSLGIRAVVVYELEDQ